MFKLSPMQADKVARIRRVLFYPEDEDGADEEERMEVLEEMLKRGGKTTFLEGLCFVDFVVYAQLMDWDLELEPFPCLERLMREVEKLEGLKQVLYHRKWDWMDQITTTSRRNTTTEATARDKTEITI